MIEHLTITADDLAQVMPIQVMSNPDPLANGRVVAKFEIIDDGSFIPTPIDMKYESGNNPKLGIKEVRVEGDKTSLVYDNPKDSAGDKYTEQQFDTKGATFIFPAQNNPQLRKDVIGAVDRIAGNSTRITVAEADQILKNVYKVYEAHGAVPDLYNGGVDQVTPTKHLPIEGEERAWGGGASKASAMKEAFIITAPKGEVTTFIGSASEHISGSEQRSEGTFVVTKLTTMVKNPAGEGKIPQVDIRKLELGYAEKDLLDKDGKPLDLSDAGIAKLKEEGKGVISTDEIRTAQEKGPEGLKKGSVEEVQSKDRGQQQGIA